MITGLQQEQTSHWKKLQGYLSQQEKRPKEYFFFGGYVSQGNIHCENGVA
jgi:hypothetical protein